MNGKTRKILSLALSFGLFFQQISFAQVAAELNIAGYLSKFNANIVQDKFRPLELRYFSYNSLNDSFKVLLDKGDVKELDNLKTKEQAKTLLSYFLVGVTLPDDKFWVNLRPDSEDQVIDNYLEKTDVGKIMLEADLQLKKDTASFTSPQTPEGRKYWDKLYKKAAELYGYDNVTIPTLTRPWIVPGEIIIKESKDSAYVYKATLKVMLEQDYLKDSATYSFEDERAKQLNDYSSQLIRELIIPKLTKEVNSSKRYSSLRQVYYSLILSRWFKLRFTGKSGSYASLINTSNLTNLTSQEPWSKTDYFKQYQKSFKDGEYNVQEPVYTPTGQVIRSYFSGGEDLTGKTMAMPTLNNPLTNGTIGIFSGNLAPPVIPGSIAMEGKGVDPTGASLHSIVVSSPISDELLSKKLNEAIQLIRSRYYDKDNNVRDAVKLIVEKGDDVLRQEVANIMYSLAQHKVEVDYDHFDQLEDGRVGMAMAQEESNVLFAIEMIQSIGGSIAIAKLETMIESWLRSGETHSKRRSIAVEAIQALRLQDEANEALLPLSIAQYTIYREYVNSIAETVLKLKRRESPNIDNFLKMMLDDLAQILASDDGSYCYAFSELIEIVIEKFDLKNTNILAYQKLQEMQGEFILKAADYYYAEILKNLPSPAEFEDDLRKLKPKLLEVIRNLKKYETGIQYIDFPTLLYPDSLAEDIQDFVCDIYYESGGIWIKGAWHMPGRYNPGKKRKIVQIVRLKHLVSEQANKGASNSSSPIESAASKKTGGIDFRVLPMTIQPMGSFSGLNFKLPQLSQAELRQVNIDSEIQQIRNMVQGGIMPSGERIKELVAACVQKGQINSHADGLLLCLVDILKVEEESASESSPELKEALVIVDSQS